MRLPFILVLFLITISSCNVFYKTANTADDVYYSRKASKEKTVIVPDVNVDEIIQKHPPQYGNPTNKVDDDVTPNYMAAGGYVGYKQRQDSLSASYPYLSGSYDPNPMPSYNDQYGTKYSNSYNNNNNNNSWMNNTGIGFGFGYNPYSGFSPSMGFGWNNYPSYGYGYGYSPYSSYYPYNSWGYNSYYPYSNWGWSSGYYGYYPYSYYPYYPYYPYNPCYSCNSGSSTDNGSNSQAPIEHARPGMGSSTPPPPNTGVRPGETGSGMVEQPQGQGQAHATEPSKPAMMRPGSNFDYAAPGAARLENVDGRMIYTPPASVQGDAPGMHARPGGDQIQMTRPSPNQNQNNGQMMRPSYNNSGNNFQPFSRPSENRAPAFQGSPGMSRPSGGSMGGGGGSVGRGSGSMQRPR